MRTLVWLAVLTLAATTGAAESLAQTAVRLKEKTKAKEKSDANAKSYTQEDLDRKASDPRKIVVPSDPASGPTGSSADRTPADDRPTYDDLKREAAFKRGASSRAGTESAADAANGGPARSVEDLERKIAYWRQRCGPMLRTLARSRAAGGPTEYDRKRVDRRDLWNTSESRAKVDRRNEEAREAFGRLEEAAARCEDAARAAGVPAHQLEISDEK